MSNIILWVLQVLVGLAFIGASYSHGVAPEQMLAQPGGQWVAALPRGLLTFIALCEFLGGVGVILPALTRIKPQLTPLAAALLALMMILAMGFHIIRGEYPNVMLNLVLFVLAAVVAYGRYALVLLKPKHA